MPPVGRPKPLNQVVADANSRPFGERIGSVRQDLQPRVDPRPGGWIFREAIGTDGTHVFYGEVGPAIIVKPDGTVVRGVMPADLRAQLVPTPRNPNPRPPFTVSDLQID